MSALTEKQVRDAMRLLGGTMSSISEKEYPYDAVRFITAFIALSAVTPRRSSRPAMAIWIGLLRGHGLVVSRFKRY